MVCQSVSMPADAVEDAHSCCSSVGAAAAMPCISSLCRHGSIAPKCEAGEGGRQVGKLDAAEVHTVHPHPQSGRQGGVARSGASSYRLNDSVGRPARRRAGHHLRLGRRSQRVRCGVTPWVQLHALSGLVCEACLTS